MKIYKTDSNTKFAIDNSSDIYIMKKDDCFYKLNKDLFFKNINGEKLIYECTIKDNFAYFLFNVIFILISLLLYFSNDKFVLFNSNFLMANIILFFNIFIHELGHILFLKYFYKDSKFKVGFKFYFIYPAFYVDTSYSYFLPKYKRASVYLAGSFMNSLYIVSSIFFIPTITKYNYLVVVSILVNFIPIIKSDGYYTFTTLFKKYNNNKTKSKVFLEDTIRGLLMFILMFLITKIF